MNSLAIAVFGFVGGVLRDFILNLGLGGTLLVNLAGSLALGISSPWLQQNRAKPWLGPGICAGLIGSTTTFSTFISDTNLLMKSSLWLAGLYVLSSLGGGIVSGFIGLRLADWAHRKHGATKTVRQR